MNRLFAFGCVIALVLAAGQAHAINSMPIVKDLNYSGGTERVLFLSPDQPKATVVLYPGGDGVVEIGADGHIGMTGNFLVHSRIRWVEQGYAIVLPDAPAGSSTLMGRRLTDSYAAAVAAAVDFAKQTNRLPVWLVGTSQGTNAVVNAASRMTHGEIAGIVLTSSLTRPGKQSDLKENVFNVNLAAINVPVLIVSHSDDACNLSPPGDDSKLAAALTGAPQVKTILISGGKPAASAPCEAESPHGFFGVEIDTIKQMASFMASH